MKIVTQCADMLHQFFFFAEELDQRKATDRARGKVAMAALRLLDRIAGKEEMELNAEALPD